jgi:alpha-mannosidase
MSRPLIHLIPHTHWDREWYLPLGAFRARLVAALDDLIDLLERDTRITTFLLDGQAVLLEDYLAVRPERSSAVTALVQNRRLQTGPWYVLADEQIPAGESLVRNLLLGGSVARRLGGSMGVLYSPDAFGHPARLPELALEFRLVGGALWRGIHPRVTGERDLAWWESPSGGRLLVYHLPAAGYEIGSNLLVPPSRLADAWRRVAAAILPRAATRHVAVFVGADHHAASPDLGELAAALQRVEPECDFRFSRLDDFLEAAGSEAGEASVFHGEQRDSYGYTWTLQGVHGTRAPLKRRNSSLELTLTRLAEPLVAVTDRRSGGGAAILGQAWREVVQCHFHDAIGGCCSDDVARAMTVRLTDATAATAELVRTGLDRLAGHDPDLARVEGSGQSCLLVWNPAARPRNGIVLADLTFFRRDVLVGPPGTRVPHHGRGMVRFTLGATDAGPPRPPVTPQILSVAPDLERLDARRHHPDQDEVDRVRIAFQLPERVDGLEVRRFELRNDAPGPLEALAWASRTRLWNRRVQLTIGPGASVTLRAPDRGKPLAGLLALESEPDLGDSYTVAPAPRAGVIGATRRGRPRVTAAGPLVAGLEWDLSLRTRARGRAAGGAVSARVRVEAIGDSEVLRVRITLNNRARDHRLRLRFPVGLTRVPILAGTQFGTLHRAPARRARAPSAMEQPVTTAPAHRFVAVARGARGLAVMAPGFFEYEWTPRGDLLITLLRCVGELSRSDLPTRPGHAGWPTAIPDAQCPGVDTIELGMALVTASQLAAPELLERLWEDTFVPPVAHWMRIYHAPERWRPSGSECALEGEGLVFSALKPAEDGNGAIMRCYSVRGHPVAGRLRLGRALARATMCRADETSVGELALSDGGRTVRFTAPALGMVSVRLEWVDQYGR